MTIVRRLAVRLAGTSGLLALLGDAAATYTGHQHCEPLVRR
jgi:hypothetical protein